MDRQQIDELLIPFFNATDEVEIDSLLTKLITEHGMPIIREIVKAKLTSTSSFTNSVQYQELEDITNEAVLQLMNRLRKVRSSPNQDILNNFHGYIARIAYNSFYNYLRQKYPLYWQLKNRVRYILTHQPGFALWAGRDRKLYAGFKVWRDTDQLICPADSIQELLNNPDAITKIGVSYEEIRNQPASLLAAVFNWAGKPIELNSLIKIISFLSANIDQRQQPTNKIREDSNIFEAIPAKEIGIDIRIEQRVYLKQLWSEINNLPLFQRCALLLNLRDEQGREALSLFLQAGIVTVRQIASAIDYPAEDFARIWNSLPLDDITIGNKLGITRQQVINLRNAARKRLSRRMRDWSG